MSSTKRSLSRTSRRNSRRSSTVARLHASAIASKNRRASLAAAAALEEKAFLEESKSSSSLASSKSSSSVASKSPKNKACDRVKAEFATPPASSTASYGSFETQDSFLSVEAHPPVHRRSFDGVYSNHSSNLLSVSKNSSRTFAASDSNIDTKKDQNNTHAPLNERLTIDQPYHLSPRRSFDASAPVRWVSKSPRPSLTTELGHWQRGVHISTDDSVDENLAETSFVVDSSFCRTPSEEDQYFTLRDSHSNIPLLRRESITSAYNRDSIARVHRDSLKSPIDRIPPHYTAKYNPEISLSPHPKQLIHSPPLKEPSRYHSISLEEQTSSFSKSSELRSVTATVSVPPDYIRKLSVSDPPDYIRKLSSTKSEHLPLSRKSSYAADLSNWKTSANSPLLESDEQRPRKHSSASCRSHLDIYRRHSSSASRISAPEASNTGEVPAQK